jgi:hypothetical protein
MAEELVAVRTMTDGEFHIRTMDEELVSSRTLVNFRVRRMPSL